MSDGARQLGRRAQASCARAVIVLAAIGCAACTPPGRDGAEGPDGGGPSPDGGDRGDAVESTADRLIREVFPEEPIAIADDHQYLVTITERGLVDGEGAPVPLDTFQTYAGAPGLVMVRADDEHMVPSLIIRLRAAERGSILLGIDRVVSRYDDVLMAGEGASVTPLETEDRSDHVVGWYAVAFADGGGTLELGANDVSSLELIHRPAGGGGELAMNISASPPVPVPAPTVCHLGWGVFCATCVRLTYGCESDRPCCQARTRVACRWRWGGDNDDTGCRCAPGRAADNVCTW